MENNIKLTVELSEMDKALLSKLLAAVDALNASLLANQGMIAIADAGTHAEAHSEPQTAQENAPGKVTTPASDAPQNAAQTATEASDAVTLADVQRKVVELCGPPHNKKAQVREIVKAYAPKVTGIPADKCAEVMDKLTALED